MEKIRYLSLFSGIEAFSQGVEGLNFEPVGFAEIEPFACEVLKTRYPNVKNYGDVSKIDGKALKGKVDLIVGGSPCQDFSQAGNRLGLEGERSSLAIEYIRLLNEIQPDSFIWENVPGCTSTNKGNDLRMLLDAFQESGYLLDVDILDSQFFGIPQRRRRIFVCGISMEGILRRKTTSSALIIAKCLLSTLRDILAEASRLRERGREKLELPSLLNDGLKKKINFLFRLGKQEEEWTSLLNVLDGVAAKFVHGQNFLDTTLGVENRLESMDASLTDLLTASQYGLTAESLKKNSEDLCLLRRLFTTSTETKTTIHEIIFICAKIALHISWLITLIRVYFPSLSIVDISDLTPMQEFTKYARWTSSSLLGDVGHHDFWLNFIRQAKLQEEAFRDTGTNGDSAREILFKFQGMPGYSSQGRESWQSDTGSIKSSTGISGGQIAQNDTFATLCASGAGCDRPSAQGSQLDYCVIDVKRERERERESSVRPCVRSFVR